MARGEFKGDVESRDLNLRSKGLSEGFGLFNRGRRPGDDNVES